MNESVHKVSIGNIEEVVLKRTPLAVLISIDFPITKCE